MIQFKSFNYGFIPKMWYFLALSALAVIGSVVLITVKGFNFGTDFKGGIRLSYRFAAPVAEGDVRRTIEPLNLGDFSVQKVGRPEENRVTIKIEQQENLETLSAKVTEALLSSLNLQGEGAVSLEQEVSVGPKAGADLRKKALMAIIVSWLLMLVYIGYRFDFAYAPGAILALIHDVLVTLGAFAFSGREVSLTVVAALLTIVGYSINDTIVIFDRIREDLEKFPKKPLRELVNTSINNTLSRTIITNLTVFMVVILIYVFGEGEFQNFGFAMIVGAISGTASTIFVASPAFILIREYGPGLKNLLSRK